MWLLFITLIRADSRFAPSQWETALLCNDVSHWRGASLEWALLNSEKLCPHKGPQEVQALECCSTYCNMIAIGCAKWLYNKLSHCMWYTLISSIPFHLLLLWYCWHLCYTIHNVIYQGIAWHKKSNSGSDDLLWGSGLKHWPLLWQMTFSGAWKPLNLIQTFT